MSYQLNPPGGISILATSGCPCSHGFFHFNFWPSFLWTTKLHRKKEKHEHIKKCSNMKFDQVLHLFCSLNINDQETYDHRKIVLDLVELHSVFSNESLHVPCDTRWGRKEPWCFWCRFHPLMATGKGFPKKYYDAFLGWEEMEDSQLGKDVHDECS